MGALGERGSGGASGFTPGVWVAAVAALVAYGGGPVPVANTEIFFCDPPGEEGPQPLDSRDVMREHLELWRSLMFSRRNSESEPQYVDLTADFFGDWGRKLELSYHFASEASGEIRMFAMGMHKDLLRGLSSVAEPAIPPALLELVRQDMRNIREHLANQTQAVSVRTDGTVLFVL